MEFGFMVWNPKGINKRIILILKSLEYNKTEYNEK